MLLIAAQLDSAALGRVQAGTEPGVEGAAGAATGASTPATRSSRRTSPARTPLVRPRRTDQAPATSAATDKRHERRRRPAPLGRWVAHQIATYVEPALQAEQDSAHGRRFLQTSREADGSLRGRFLLSREDSEAFPTAVEPLARRTDLSDARSADHQPVSFAASILGDLPGSARAPSAHGCATAAWSGPQTRARVEAILCDARISRLLLDSTGRAQPLETLSGGITKGQRRLLAARDLGCTASRCTLPPATCDAHHLDRTAAGGPTTTGNLVPLCRRHHVLWHKGKLSPHDLRLPWHTGPPPAQEAAHHPTAPGTIDRQAPGRSAVWLWCGA